MIHTGITLISSNQFTAEEDEVLIGGLNKNSALAKNMDPISFIGYLLKGKAGQVYGGIKGVLLHGCLHVDTLWVEKKLRNHGWGKILVTELEIEARKQGCYFATVHTMDWEARHFYEKLGYEVEFIRKGYAKDSFMYLLRKQL